MPRNQFQRMVFAFLTVLVTVHGYVFYSLYVINGNTLMQINNADSVIHAINAQGGVYMFGNMLPIWAVVMTEFCCAYILECLIGSPLSFKMACRMFDPRNNHPMIFETVIISCTVLIIFARDIAARSAQAMPDRPQNEQEAIADIYRRMDEIQENLAHERRQRKKLAEQMSHN